MKKALILILLLAIFMLVGCELQGGDEPTPTPHSCTHKCPDCGKCTDPNCNDPVCANKCQGHVAPAALIAPTNIVVKKGVVTFDEAEGADSYNVKVLQDGAIVINMKISSGDDLTSMLEDGDYELQIRSNKGTEKSEFSSKVNFHIGFEKVVVAELNEIIDFGLKDPDYINYDGRTLYNETKKIMTFYYTASGFKVSFTGTELKATFVSENKTNTAKGNARLVILVDGEVYPDEGHTLILLTGEKEYTIASGLTEGKHTVQVLKRTESADNTTSVKSIKTDGHFEAPEQDKAKRILLIGASGSAGHGSIGKSDAAQSASNSDGLRAFPYLTARMYDAEIDEINASGWGCLWGWNDNSGKTNMPLAFTRVGITKGAGLTSTTYDYTKDSYDLIILNLGMNDFNAHIKSVSDATTKASDIEKYKAATKKFYELLTSTYDCPIIIIHTSNTDSNAEGKYNEAIAAEVNAALGSTRIYSIVIPANGAKGAAYGANSHANVQTHIWTADLIAECIEENLHWTKVRQNITYSSTRDLSEINVLQ